MKKTLKNMDKNKEETKDKKVEKEETIVVNKGALDKILNTIEEQGKTIEMLKEVSDKSRLAVWDDKHKTKGLTIVKVSTYDDKVVLGWETVVNEVFKNGNGVWIEKQIIKLHFSDNTELDINYLDFVTRTVKIEAEVNSRTTGDGTEILNIKTKDGREFSIDIKFVN